MPLSKRRPRPSRDCAEQGKWRAHLQLTPDPPSAPRRDLCARPREEQLLRRWPTDRGSFQWRRPMLSQIRADIEKLLKRQSEDADPIAKPRLRSVGARPAKKVPRRKLHASRRLSRNRSWLRCCRTNNRKSQAGAWSSVRHAANRVLARFRHLTKRTNRQIVIQRQNCEAAIAKLRFCES